MTEKIRSRVIVIDDDLDILKISKKFLEDSGYEAAVVSDASKAVAEIKTFRPDLILLDAMMPDLSGYDICTELQRGADTAVIPIIFVTALEQEEDRATAFACGAVDYLVKPVNKSQLIEKVALYINKKRSWDDLQDAKRKKTSGKAYYDFERFKPFLAASLNMTPAEAAKLDGLSAQALFSDPIKAGVQSRALARLSADFTGLEYFPLINPDEINMGVLPVSFCRKNYVIILGQAGGGATAVLSNPFNMELVDILRSSVDPSIKTAVTEAENIDSLLNIDADDGARVTVESVYGPSHVVEKGSEADITKRPVLYITDRILESSITERASDIHMEPKETHTTVRFRINGDLQDFFTLKLNTGNMVISRLKALAGMDISDHRRPQDGAFSAIVGTRSFILRLATTSTPYGESLVMRIVEPGAKPKKLQELGMEQHQSDIMMDFAARNNGLVLIVGPTGSGKTTTIFSLLSHIDCSKRSLISVEDPVEYRIPLANQQQVNERAGITFESLLKSSVRQDPDILFIGEVRDQISARIAIDFASTAHLAVSTVHTPNATSAIFRLERLGISREVLADTLIGIVAQRLIKQLCPYCKQIADITDEEKAMLAQFTDEKITKVAHPVGCHKCNKTGYIGREGVYEIINFDIETAALVRSGKPIAEIRQRMIKRGDYLIGNHALDKVKRFICTVSDVYQKVLVEEIAAKRGDASYVDKNDEPATARVSETKAARPPEPALSEPEPARQNVEPAVVKPEPKVPKAEGRQSVLVIDDDEPFLALTGKILEQAGYRVALAKDGIDGLMQMAASDFDLAIVDIRMPNLDGFKLAEVMRQKGISVPLIFLTAGDNPEQELQALGLGAQDYITKPVNKDVLCLRVRNAILRASR